MMKRVVFHWLSRLFMPGRMLRAKYEDFRRLLDGDHRSLEIIADLQDVFYSVRPADRVRVKMMCAELGYTVTGMIESLQGMDPLRYRALTGRLTAISDAVEAHLAPPEANLLPPYVLPLAECAGRNDLAGGKGANLARVSRETDLAVPPGFVITTCSYHRFMEDNGLRPAMTDMLAGMAPAGSADFNRDCRKMQELVLDGEVPEVVMWGVDRELERLCRETRGKYTRFAVRSSAWAEDGQSSFAGQYDTRLNVASDDLQTAYREVLASKYSPRAVTYRLLRGLADEETPMAVVVLPMIEARTAGVAYTEDRACEACISVHAGRGPGETLVGGEVRPDVFFLKKADPPKVTHVPGSAESLHPDEAVDVATVSMALERVFGVAQDVEWVQDREGRIWVLQSRPFHGEPEEGPPLDLGEMTPFLSGLSTVSMGVGCGPLVHFDGVQGMGDLPRGSVPVFDVLSPDLTTCLDRVAAVIGMSGGRASHFGTVAREFGVPVVVGGSTALDGLPDGLVVTVDASTGTIYEGCADASLSEGGNGSRRGGRVLSSCYRQLVPLVTRLNLKDPDASGFQADQCQSLHDIVRYVHEKGMQEIFFLGGRTGRGLGRAPKLETVLPLALYVVDLRRRHSGGRGKTIRIDDVGSVPLEAVWKGIEEAGARWEEGLYHADWETVDRISGGIFSKDARFLSSYALVSRDYMHMLIRFGYHFTVLDTLCGPTPEVNYIAFRFKGGGGGSAGGRLRLHFIGTVLEACRFQVTIRGDMLDARIVRVGETTARRLLSVLGGLLAQTRLLDMSLTSKVQAEVMATAYLERWQVTR